AVTANEPPPKHAGVHVAMATPFWSVITDGVEIAERPAQLRAADLRQRADDAAPVDPADAHFVFADVQVAGRIERQSVRRVDARVHRAPAVAARRAEAVALQTVRRSAAGDRGDDSALPVDALFGRMRRRAENRDRDSG